MTELWRCLALLDDLLGRVEQQTDDGHGDDYHAARLGADHESGNGLPLIHE